ncbi:MAG: chorismate lyase [Gammaproteobacteria bacterium]|nr:chorismate lyase [Gammaproteobacteria bacterium]
MKENFGKHAGEPVWRNGFRLSRGQLPGQWRDWLLDRSSLTLRLQRACPGSFRVEVVSQRMEPPLLSEARALHRPPQELALVRQVRLRCDEQPWVFARTVIPLPSLRGGLRQLALLGNRPLGSVLFADPTMHRSAVEVARVGRGKRLFALALAGTDAAAHRKAQEIWGRRSVFTLRGQPLLVSEFFLPDLTQRPPCAAPR